MVTEFQLRLRRRNIPDAEILLDMQRVACELDSATLTARQYDTRGLFGSTSALRRFKTWNEALALAGLQISNRQDIRREELFENIAEVWKKIGQQPSGRHMSDKVSGSLFSRGTYEKRFGSWNSALIAFSEFISDTGRASTEELAFPAKGIDVTQIRSRRTSREINWRLRAKILIRDSCICRMCGDSPAKSPDTILHVDHILAWANGGETVEENLQTLCAKCNIGKSDEFLPGQSGSNDEPLAFSANLA